jgi:formimidoylglutamate deiminase
MFAPIQTSSQSLSEDFCTCSPDECLDPYDTAKMSIYRLKSAYLPQGWARDVRIAVSDQGFITEIGTHSPAQPPVQSQPPAQLLPPVQPQPPLSTLGETIDGFVVPGMPNAHSHAFQRAMAGNTEHRLSARDSFWTWRQMMYGLANRIEPDDLQILATQLYIEMLKAGYTSVAEFHYLHGQSNGAPYSGTNPLWDAIGNAAAAAGIGLTFLPTLYQTGDFGGQPLRAEQARFGFRTDVYLKALEIQIRADRRAGSSSRRTGAAFHSLRAVPIEVVREVTQAVRDIDATMPVHIHVAEQLLEVRACERATGRRPVELLLDHSLLTEQWCLVHATHATPEELAGLAATNAVVCLSISTEANLGDGLFDAARFLNAGGRLCIGSDSQSTVNPAEELRWLEYQQRLRKKRRGVLATNTEPHVGTRLWRDAAQYGAQAIGQPAGTIAVGQRADWLVLDATHPSMAGAAAGEALDHLLFAGGSAAIRDVMVAGRWVIKNSRHEHEDDVRRRFATVMRQFGAS